MIPYKNLVTPEQYENAKKHWNKLIKGDISGRFDMSEYTDNCAYEKVHNVCGTAACSAGYIPETLCMSKELIDMMEEKCDMSNIPTYGYFTEVLLGISYEGNKNAWNWCFSYDWVLTDNSAKGAGIRMRILFEEGLPKSHIEQMNGYVKLSYKNEL